MLMTPFVNENQIVECTTQILCDDANPKSALLFALVGEKCHYTFAKVCVATSYQPFVHQYLETLIQSQYSYVYWNASMENGEKPEQKL
mmetsp:Transcript_27290/g.54690  ORF Transcript_27290/g.54690 Transcript_27290/m.54690 type:complete len:88 (-) Transcript_27290:262-525(-)